MSNFIVCIIGYSLESQLGFVINPTSRGGQIGNGTACSVVQMLLLVAMVTWQFLLNYSKILRWGAF